MSISSETASSSHGVGKGKIDMSPAAIAAYNKRRLNGDYGHQPDLPSIGIKIGEGASTSAIKASNAQLGPKLWYPKSSATAQRASTLASSSSSSIIPDAHYVEDPKATALASKAATSASSISGEEYGAKHQPDAYQWGKKQSQWAHLGAQRSSAAAERQEERIGLQTLTKPPPSQSIDISKVLSAAQKNAHDRIANADNHLPANFGIPTEEDQYQRRQQVLSLIQIADRRVKDQIAELDRDMNSHRNVFGSIEFHKIALDIAAKSAEGRDVHRGKLNLGGGLYMTQDEVDDIARRHVQPVLDKVQLVAEKKRIADREAEARAERERQEQAEAREEEKRRRAEEKQRNADEKAKAKAAQAAQKAKAQRAAERSKQNHEPGSHLWHWQQVEAIKDDVKDAKEERLAKEAEASRLHKLRDQTQEDLDTLIQHHRELKSDYFERGDAIEKKQSEYDDPEAAETASMFDLRQQRETVKDSTKAAKQKRVELEDRVKQLDSEAAEADKEAEEAQKRHRELKKKYFEAQAEAEEAEKKFQAEEEIRLKREAEERAKREAEEAERRQKEAEAAAKSKAEAASRAKSSGTADKKSSGGAAAATSAAAASSSAGAAAAGKPAKQAAAEAPEEEFSNVKLPPKSQLLDMGDARSGPILSGYPVQKRAAAAPTSAKTETPANAETEKAAAADAETSAVAKETEEPKLEESPAEESKAVEAEPAESKETEATESKETEGTAVGNTAEALEEPSPVEATEPLAAEAAEEQAEAETGVAEETAEAEQPATQDAAVPEVEKTVEPTEEKAAVTETETPTTETGEKVAGAVAAGPIEDVVDSGEIPLGGAGSKDAFSGFDSSNVKEKVEESTPGLFKEDIK